MHWSSEITNVNIHENKTIWSVNLDAFMLLHSRTKGKQIHILYTVLQYGPSGSIGHVLTQKIALSTKNRAMWMIPNSQHVLMYLWRIIIIFHVLINLYYWSWTHRGTMQRNLKTHAAFKFFSFFFSQTKTHDEALQWIHCNCRDWPDTRALCKNKHYFNWMF